jgi:hypothetical protein
VLAYEKAKKDDIICLLQKGVKPLVGAASEDSTNMGVIDVTTSLSAAAFSDCGVTP